MHHRFWHKVFVCQGLTKSHLDETKTFVSDNWLQVDEKKLNLNKLIRKLHSVLHLVPRTCTDHPYRHATSAWKYHQNNDDDSWFKIFSVHMLRRVVVTHTRLKSPLHPLICAGTYISTFETTTTDNYSLDSYIAEGCLNVVPRPCSFVCSCHCFTFFSENIFALYFFGDGITQCEWNGIYANHNQRITI